MLGAYCAGTMTEHSERYIWPFGVVWSLGWLQHIYRLADNRVEAEFVGSIRLERRQRANDLIVCLRMLIGSIMRLFSLEFLSINTFLRQHCPTQILQKCNTDQHTFCSVPILISKFLYQFSFRQRPAGDGGEKKTHIKIRIYISRSVKVGAVLNVIYTQ